MIIESIVVLFGLFALSRTYLRMREGKLNAGQFIFWALVWIGIMVLVFVPGVIGTLSTLLGIERPIDVAVYSSIVLLFYLIFRIYVKISDIEREITTLVSEIAKR